MLLVVVVARRRRGFCARLCPSHLGSGISRSLVVVAAGRASSSSSSWLVVAVAFVPGFRCWLGSFCKGVIRGGGGPSIFFGFLGCADGGRKPSGLIATTNSQVLLSR